jgi:hypothetical protein
MAVGGPSCLVASTPEFPIESAKGPFITGLTVPPYGVIALDKTGTPPTFPSLTFPFVVRSEDLGRDLQYFWFVDYPGGTDSATSQDRRNALQGGNTHVPAGTFDESKSLSFTLDTTSSTLTPGCHSVTLLVTHSYDILNATSDPDDTDLVTWWLDVDDPTRDKTLMGTCRGVNPGNVALDGGVE